MTNAFAQGTHVAGAPSAGAAFREAAAAYVDALSRAAAPSPDLARMVEARDPRGRLRLLGLAMRDLRQGRPQDAAVRLRGMRLKSAEARRAVAAQIDIIARLPARPAQG